MDELSYFKIESSQWMNKKKKIKLKIKKIEVLRLII